MAVSGHGTIVAVNDGVSASYDDFSEAFAVTVPTQELNYLECTRLASPGRRREYIGGMIDPGEFSFSIRWNENDIVRLESLVEVTKNWRLTYPNGAKHEFDAFVTKYESEIGFDTVLDVKVTCRVTGEPIFTVAP